MQRHILTLSRNTFHCILWKLKTECPGSPAPLPWILGCWWCWLPPDIWTCLLIPWSCSSLSPTPSSWSSVSTLQTTLLATKAHHGPDLESENLSWRGAEECDDVQDVTFSPWVTMYCRAIRLASRQFPNFPVVAQIQSYLDLTSFSLQPTDEGLHWGCLPSSNLPTVYIFFVDIR